MPFTWIYEINMQLKIYNGYSDRYGNRLRLRAGNEGLRAGFYPAPDTITTTQDLQGDQDSRNHGQQPRDMDKQHSQFGVIHVIQEDAVSGGMR